MSHHYVKRGHKLYQHLDSQRDSSKGYISSKCICPCQIVETSTIQQLYWLLLQSVSTRLWAFPASLGYLVGRDTDSRYRFVLTQRIWINLTHIMSTKSFRERYFMDVARFTRNLRNIRAFALEDYCSYRN